MNSKAVAALAAARKVVSQDKRQQVRDALEAAVHESARINISAIAERAEVTRQFVYDHPDLEEAIKAAKREAVRAKAKPKPPPSNADMDQGEEAKRLTLAAKVERQKETIAELHKELDDLKEQRARWLGSQVEQQEVVSPEEYAELRLVCDRLMENNGNLTRTVAEVRRINSILESDLAASREAHATDLSQRNSGTVTPIAVRKPSDS